MLNTLKPAVRRALLQLPGGHRIVPRLAGLYRRFAQPASDLPPLRDGDAARPPRVALLSPDTAPDLGARLAAAAPDLLVPVTGRPQAAELGCTYLYAPSSAGLALSPDALRMVLLGLSSLAADFVIVSHTLEEAPALALAGALRDHAVFAVDAAPTFLEGAQPQRPLTGRLLRSLPAPQDRPLLATTLEAVLGFAGPACQGAWITLGGTPAVEPPARLSAGQDLPFPRFDGGRPLVLVLPIFLAVGGVERNTIEIIRALRDRYDFLVVTSERLAAPQGSLHHQLKGLAAVFDLAELAENGHHLAMLTALVRSYRPSLVWICNGSPWLVHHAGQLRELFRDTPIIDQQCYDAELGWIEHYPTPGIQSFDRFIAINQRIRSTFVGRLGMDPGRIDLIYSAIDAPRFDKPEPDDAERRRLSDLTGIPLERRAYAFIGRLTEQKAPLAFLELARRSAAGGSPDRFILIGDGVLGGDCDRFIAGNALANVQRIPFCNDLTTVYPLLAGLVVSSRYEGLPIAMLEAMAMGLPVLATDVGDIRPVLEEYASGVVVPPDDVEALAAGFQAFSADLPAFTERAKAAAPLVRHRFSTRTIAGEYEACWDRALSDRRQEAV